MAETKTDEIQLRVTVDGTPARKELAERQEQVQKLRTEQEKLLATEKALRAERDAAKTSGNGAEVKRLNTELAALRTTYGEVTKAITANKDRQAELRKEIGITALSLGELRKRAQELRSTLSTSSEGSANYKQLEAELVEVEARMASVGSAAARQMRVWEDMRKTLSLTQMTVQQLGLEEKRLQALMANPATGSDERQQAAKELALVKDRTEQLTNANRIAADAWEVNRKEVALLDMTMEQMGLEQKRLQAIMNTARPDSAEYQQAARQMGILKDRSEQLTSATRQAAMAWEQERKGIALVDMSMEQLAKEITHLKAEQSKLNPRAQAAEFTALGKSIQAAEDRVSTLSNNLGPMQRMWRNVKQELSGVVGLTAGLFAGGMITSQIGNWISGAAKMSDSLANVKKSTGLTREEVEKLNQELGTIDTRTTTEALREIATGLGQVGEAASKANVEALDKIVVALGDEFGANGTEITNTLSVLRNNLNDIKSGDYAADVLSIGNALNELGANGLATAPVVSNIANRIAGVARTFKVSSGEILGTAGTFQELGIAEERGSTAYIKLLQKMAAEPAKFAAVVKSAGMDANQFASDINNNMQAAFVTLARAAQQAGTDNAAFAGILKELDVDGAGVSELLAKIGVNYGLLQEKTDLATQALTENTSILAEFADRNSTLGAELDKLGKDINKVFASGAVREWFFNLITGAREAIGWITKNRDAVVFWLKVIGTATASWASYRVATAAANAATAAWGRAQQIANTVMLLFNTRARAAAAAATAKATADRVAAGAAAAGAAATTAQATATAGATTAQTALNTAMKANPIGLIVSGITTLITLFISFTDEVESAAAAQDQLNANLQKFKDLNAGKTDIDKQVRAIDTLNRRQLEALQEQVNTEVQAEEDRVVRFEGQYKRASAVAKELGALRAKGDNDAAQVFAMQNAGVLDALAQRLGDAQELVDKAGNRRKASEQELTAFLRREEVTRLKNIGNEVALELVGNKEKPTNPMADMSGISEQDREKVKEGMEKIRQDMAELRRDMLIDAMSADEQEVAQVDVKYQKIRAEILANELHTAEDLAALDEAWGQARINTIEAQGQKRIEKKQENDAAYLNEQRKTQAELLNFLDSEHQKELAAEVELWEQRVQTAKSMGVDYTAAEEQLHLARQKQIDAQAFDVLQAEISKFDRLITLAKQHGIDTTELEAAKGRALLALQTEQHNAETAEGKRHNAEMRGIVAQRLNMFSTIAGGMNDLVAGIKQYGDAQLTAMEQAADADGVRTQEELANIQARKEAAREQALLSIYVQGAIAIANGVASAMTLQPWPLAVASALSTVGIVMGLMAQATSLMNQGAASASANAPAPALNTVPLGAEGGRVGEGRFQPAQSGILDGPSHNDGGLGVYNERTGRKVAEFEGGEAYMLLSKRFTDLNRDQLSSLLEASRTGRRIRITSGTGPLPRPNPDRVSKAMMPEYAAGGIIRDGKGQGVTYSAGTGIRDGGKGQGLTYSAGTGKNNGGEGTPDWATAMLEKMGEMVKATSENRYVQFSLRDYDRKVTEYETLKDRNTVKRAS